MQKNNERKRNKNTLMGHSSAKELSKRIGLLKPVLFQIGKETQFFFSPEKTIVCTNLKNYRENMPVLIATAYLGEQDPLIVSLDCFSNGASKEEDESMKRGFLGVCAPLRNAWGYKVLQKKTPDIYGKIVHELLREIDEVANTGKIDDQNKLQTLFTAIAIASSDPDLGSLKHYDFVHPDGQVYQELQKKYLETIVRFACMEPSANLYVDLVSMVAMTHRASLVFNERGRHFFLTRP